MSKEKILSLLKDFDYITIKKIVDTTGYKKTYFRTIRFN